MSYYVHRFRRSDDREGWTGSIRSERQANKEADAWEMCGWDAEVVPNSPEIRKQVRTWEKQARASHTY